MQDEILSKNPDGDLAVYAVWFNVLSTDSVGQWDPGLLTDPRVTELWDADGAVGQWFGDRRDALQLGFFGGTLVWDSSLLYGREASWKTEPGPLEHFGYTIIGDSDGLRRTIQAVWATDEA